MLSAPPCGSISGYVYADANNNGLFDPGEKPLPGDPIQLLAANGSPIASTVTDANGFYDFSIDPRISTASVALTQTATVPSTPTDFSNVPAVGPIRRFDPSLGTLTSVEVINTGTITSTITAQNTTAGTPVSVSISGAAIVQGPGVSLTTPINNPNIPNPNPNSIHFVASATNTVPVTLTDPASLALYTGSGDIAFTESASAHIVGSGGGNGQALFSTVASTSVKVVYHYIPNNCLPAGSYTVVQQAVPTGYVPGKVSRNGTIVPQTPGAPASIPLSFNGSTNLVNNDFGELLSTPPTPVVPPQPIVNPPQPIVVPPASGAVSAGSGPVPGAGSIAQPLPQTVVPLVRGVVRQGVHLQPVSVIVGFNTPMNPARAENPANYSIVPLDWRGRAIGRPVRLRSVFYNPVDQTSTLVPFDHLNVHRYFRLTVNGTFPNGLTDTQGTFLSGAGLNLPGTNYTTLFGRDRNVRFIDHQGNLDTLGYQNGRLRWIVLQPHVAPPIGLRFFSQRWNAKLEAGAAHPKFVHQRAFSTARAPSAQPFSPALPRIDFAYNPAHKHDRRHR